MSCDLFIGSVFSQIGLDTAGTPPSFFPTQRLETQLSLDLIRSTHAKESNLLLSVASVEFRIL